MRLWLSLVLLVTTLPAAAAVTPGQWEDLPKDFPEKALDFMERRSACIDLGRDKSFAAKLRCRSLDADEIALKKAYADNPSVLRFLEISRDWDLRNEPPFFRRPQP